MPSIAELQNTQDTLIRKALSGSFFNADFSQPAITEITHTSGPNIGTLKALPAGTGAGKWDDVGLLTDAGMSFSRDTSSEDVTSFGRITPTRTDIISDITSITIVAQETKAKTLALASGVAPSALVLLAGGELKIAKPARPTSRQYRGLAVAVDDVDAGEIYMARSMPNMKPSAFGAVSFAKGADPIQYEITFVGHEDPALGYTEAWHFGGPGWAALLDDMGFAPPPGAVAVKAEVVEVLPTGGPIAGNDAVYIRGNGFAGTTGAAGVKFGTVNATDYNVIDDNTISAISPANTAGAKEVIVTNPSGVASTLGDTYLYA